MHLLELDSRGCALWRVVIDGYCGCRTYFPIDGLILYVVSHCMGHHLYTSPPSSQSPKLIHIERLFTIYSYPIFHH